MKEEIPDMDISDYSETQLSEVSERFAHLSQVVDERRKLRIKHNGLCLLIAYCLKHLMKILRHYNPAQKKRSNGHIFST
jgi:hypothetical protein